MHILTHKGLYNSAKLLAEKFKQARGKPVFVYTDRKPEDSGAPLVRWGNGQHFFNNDTSYNSREVIGVCGSKSHFASAMQRAGIPHVEYYRGTEPNKFPVVIRTVLNGHGGEGIVICKSIEEYRRNYAGHVWSYWYNFDFELGVHILNGRVERVFKKVWKNDSAEPEFPIRNTDRGYNFSLKEIEKYPKLQTIVDEFYRAVPLKMGRLDIAWDKPNKTYRIIEANSAPSLSENVNTLNMYAEFLLQELRF